MDNMDYLKFPKLKLGYGQMMTATQKVHAT